MIIDMFIEGYRVVIDPDRDVYKTLFGIAKRKKQIKKVKYRKVVGQYSVLTNGQVIQDKISGTLIMNSWTWQKYKQDIAIKNYYSELAP